MRKIKVAINGFGRIGRNVLKIALKRDNIDVIGINARSDNRIYAHLLKYDSTQGAFNGEVSYVDNALIINGNKIRVTHEDEPLNIKWAESPDVVVEATGVFSKISSPKGGYGDHIKAGAKKVLLTVPSKDNLAKMIVAGVNDNELKPTDIYVSNASCTTNCIAPIAKVLNDVFGIELGLMTTVHAYTLDQRILDGPHNDLRRSRAAALSIIPTTTGAAKAVGKVLPALEGKMDGVAMRVPVPTGSILDFDVQLSKPATIASINAAVKAAADGDMKGIVEYTEDPIVSCDIIHNSHSSIFDASLTMVMKDACHVKVVLWYDNEWGYSTRVVDLIERMCK
ncbi:MAG: type I glyceraldehyde-3-phosphate dehydrogenase [Bacteroidales bacterium]|jgi:glyceraldehyde 3-phosphate dehydrogenase|nr:type I glyceraldehyde-3-phosphate dehydrogenase [Bacteroidales bacterium]MDD2204684.1 type I glyceraldehyde-3-phosphate dehydrogenase [Bacteroidales bacterium]MDD3151771.1 type I glyceraldehyde-3-phosphate dehydrogenase [Bacteroidales bacterium]MDD3914087.1 type I glyceraldehyde-3-phosphate dehydrogenase [Bacteroidales bacterium]MDD4634011.1 type I glyceraldehyde-3-phosphate dehydrogenase [Bacteroidales bacterium]